MNKLVTVARVKGGVGAQFIGDALSVPSASTSIISVSPNVSFITLFSLANVSYFG